jgi:predicted tellurium resistance membrane protein TerC
VFAVDSIPAIFAVAQNSFLVYTSNVFAILGVRSLYFLLADVVNRFHYLKLGLAAVLGRVWLSNACYRKPQRRNTLGECIEKTDQLHVN